MKVSLIIPCYNDGSRISPIISAAQKSKLVSEIIVVDDGSQIPIPSIAGVKLIRHPQNLGKSQALKTGVLNGRGDILVFVDSDLLGFTCHHLDALIRPVATGNYDITISDRQKEVFYNRATGFSVAFTGDRAISKGLLLRNLDIFNVDGYLIEPAFNLRFFHPNFKIVRILFKGVGQPFKAQKWGPFALWQDYCMTRDIIKYLGVKNFLCQLRFVQKLPHLR